MMRTPQQFVAPQTIATAIAGISDEDSLAARDFEQNVNAEYG
jgi:hypothetical protein